MAYDLVTPSCIGGVEILRGLEFGARARFAGSGWRFDRVDLPNPPLLAPWQAFDLWPLDILRDADVEWLLERGLATRECKGHVLAITENGRKFLGEIDDAARRFGAPKKVADKDNIGRFIDALARDHPDEDSFVLAQIAAQHMLLWLFGEAWLQRHVLNDRTAADFFRNAHFSEQRSVAGMLRMIQLAETAYNLQHVPGSQFSIEKIKGGEIEPGFAELEVGKLLHIFHHDFRFVKQSYQKGSDFDLLLHLDGQRVCAETKCKIETTEMKRDTVVQSLQTARKQLPGHWISVLELCKNARQRN